MLFFQSSKCVKSTKVPKRWSSCLLQSRSSFHNECAERSSLTGKNFLPDTTVYITIHGCADYLEIPYLDKKEESCFPFHFTILLPALLLPPYLKGTYIKHLASFAALKTLRDFCTGSLHIVNLLRDLYPR